MSTTTSTTSSGSISFSGLSSGLDTDSIVTALTSTETAQKTALQTKQSNLALKQTAYATIKSGLSSVAQSAGTLNTASTYNTVTSAVSDATVASVATTAGSAVGTYNLVVGALAKADKIASARQADTTTALGKTGTAVVNGKALKIESTDSLTNIAQKVNALGAGVTASILDGGSGSAYLTFSSSATGTSNAVSVGDLSGSAFADLGLTASGSAVRQTSGATAVGYGFSSETGTLASVLGATGLGASTVTVGGTSLSVDPSTDTLDSLAAKINAAGISGVTASVQSNSTSGTTTYRLQIAGTGSTPAMSDSGGLLQGLGILRATPGSELVAAQDASYTLDGVALTSATNTIIGVIAGATLSLKKLGSTDVDVTKDTSAITNGVQGLVTAANGLFSTIAQYSTFDSKTFDTGVLFGDSVAEQAKTAVRNLLFTDVPGASGVYKNLASVGLGLDSDGNVTFDATTFGAALDKDPSGVQSLLQSTGTGSNSSLKYVSAATTAKASLTTNPYAVNITQAATKASLVAGTAETSPRTAAELLTFRGSAFGANGISVSLAAGTGLSDTVAAINADNGLKDLVVASVENGRLRIDAKKYGTGGDFTLASNFASSPSNSGVGVGGEGTYTAALNVAGTIAGEAATGSGQFLTGATGNANTAGLQILYSGTATGNVGTMSYSRGLGSQLTDLVNGFTKSTTGLFAAADTSLQTQIDSLDKDISTMTDRIASKTLELKNRFSAMESAIASLKSTANTVTSMLGTNTTSS